MQSSYFLRLFTLTLATIALTSYSISTFAQQQLSYKLYFESDSSSITEEQKKALFKFKRSLDTIIPLKIKVDGYCDFTGRNGHNDTLSLKRANTLFKYFRKYKTKHKIDAQIQGNGVFVDKTGETGKHDQRYAEILIDYRSKNAPNKSIKVASVNRKKKNSKPNINTNNAVELSDNLKVGDQLRINNILFEGGRHKLLPESKPYLKQLYAELKAKPQYSIEILGYICCHAMDGTDGRDNGTGLNNLSHARAKAVYKYLVDKGIDKKRLGYKGMKVKPTGYGPKYDRRVELRIVDVKKSAM